MTRIVITPGMFARVYAEQIRPDLMLRERSLRGAADEAQAKADWLDLYVSILQRLKDRPEESVEDIPWDAVVDACEGMAVIARARCSTRG